MGLQASGQLQIIKFACYEVRRRQISSSLGRSI